jgi:hypothetical protein
VAEAVNACDITSLNLPASSQARTQLLSRSPQHSFPAIMQDPERTVDNGHGLDLSNDAEATSPRSPIHVDTTPPATEASAFSPTATPTVSAPTGVVDEATRKAVDNVLYSDVRFLRLRRAGPMHVTVH